MLVLVMSLSMVACGSSAATKMTMGTGGTSGTYYGYGGVLGQYIKNNAGIDVTVVSTDGSKANIQGIASGDYQLGIVQSDVMAYAWEGTRSFEKDGKVDSFRVVEACMQNLFSWLPWIPRLNLLLIWQANPFPSVLPLQVFTSTLLTFWQQQV